MRDQQILWIDGLAPEFRIEIRATRGKSTTLQNVIRVPARLIIVAIHVDRAEYAQRIGQGQLMLKRMACKDGVALLDIDAYFVLQPIAFQETIDRGHIVVVLMLGRFLRFWLEIGPTDPARETNQY